MDLELRGVFIEISWLSCIFWFKRSIVLLPDNVIYSVIWQRCKLWVRCYSLCCTFPIDVLLLTGFPELASSNRLEDAGSHPVILMLPTFPIASQDKFPGMYGKFGVVSASSHDSLTALKLSIWRQILPISHQTSSYPSKDGSKAPGFDVACLFYSA